MYSRGELFMLSREGYFGVYYKNQNNTRVSVETVRHESKYIILFLTRRNESINDARTRIFAHHPVSHSLTVRSADDVTIDWRWRHNDQTIVTRTRDKWYLTR